jgi:hypothetical protein
MITAFRVSDLVATAAEFRLADHLADGPKSSAELARLCGAHAETLHRVLRALARLELVRLVADGRFALAPLGEPLRSDVPDSRSNVRDIGFLLHDAVDVRSIWLS